MLRITAPAPLICYLWAPETNDNVAPGLDSFITYLQSKSATINITK